jgi:hypothetical protein
MRTIAALSTMSVLVVCFAAATTAAADGEPPCLADINRWCNQVPPVGNFVQGCLQEKGDAVSTGCRKHLGTLTRDSAALAAACQRDLTRFCANERIAAGWNENCLMKHRDDLSSTCADALNEQSRE